MKIPLLRIAYDEADIKYIKDEIEKVLRSGYLTMSGRVKEFEARFAKYCGTGYAVGTNTGTSSIEIILRAIGVKGSTVIVPSNTYMATPIAVIKAEGRVIFAECQRENLQIDPDDIERKIRSDTKGVIIVHIGGIISPHIEKIREICRKKGLFLIEDAAHAHGAAIDGRRAGSLCLAGSFSFYPTKVLTTAEGGMITTEDEEIYKKALVLREHGKGDPAYNVHVEIGDNWRFSELHAVLGIQQMMKADWILKERRRAAQRYNELLSDFEGIRLLEVPSNIEPSYYKYIAFLDERIDRKDLKEMMRHKYDISLPGEVYSDPCHSQPVFKKYPGKAVNTIDRFPNTEYVCRHHVCLPLYPGLSDSETEYVAASLKECLASCSVRQRQRV
ncbi:MAG: DegT/DnrJ/EryC1/StrS family aminotransferase [Deltaproteobacteria bacterium]|nr:DegT/DnrJ/EryC1/StrS family aminotransferase [Deltaproteobacteria bacterium]